MLRKAHANLRAAVSTKPYKTRITVQSQIIDFRKAVKLRRYDKVKQSKQSRQIPTLLFDVESEG